MKQNNAIAITSIISAAVLIIALSFLSVFGPTTSDNVLEIEGTATIKAIPDLTEIYIGIENTGSTSEEANNLNSEILENLTSGLIQEGFKQEDLKTLSFNVYQNYEWINGVRKEKGYIASHLLSVEMPANETSKVGKVVDSVLKSGARVNSINFKLTSQSQSKYKAEAMKRASEDAEIKAKAVAEGFGKEVGKLVSVKVNNYNYVPWVAYEKVGDGYDVTTVTRAIQPSEEEITASVLAVFSLK